MNLLWQGGR
ncbi:hypothetical protein YPPY16_3205, partial [Yersinia pestis PY-16]